MIPEIAAKLYGLSIALDATAWRTEQGLPPAHDVDLWVYQGKALLARAVDPAEPIAPGAQSVYVLDAGAAFLRSWARHLEPDRAGSVLVEADILEGLRELAAA